MIYVADTNFLIDYPESVFKHDLVYTSHVSREFEKLEKTKDSLKKQIMRAKKFVDLSEKVIYDSKDYNVTFSDNLDDNYTDNKLLQCCIENNYGLATSDLNLRNKARMYNIPLLQIESNYNDDYTGVHELYLDPNDLDDAQTIVDLMQNPTNKFGLVRNQYLIAWDVTKPTYNDDGKLIGYEPIDKLQFRFDGEKLVKLKFKPIRQSLDTVIKPVNIKQKLAFDMMQNKDITIKAIFGGFGVGKDFIMISHAIKLLQDPTSGIDKIVWVRNNVEVKDTNPIGFLPDGMQDKLLPFLMPLCDHLGGMDKLQIYLRNGKVEIQHLGFIRGRDIKNAIIYATECENNTVEHIQLLIGRVGEGSQLWLNGDMKQIDDKKFEVNSGLNALKKLKGQALYGQVTLDKVERSETARLADLLD